MIDFHEMLNERLDDMDPLQNDLWSGRNHELILIYFDRKSRLINMVEKEYIEQVMYCAAFFSTFVEFLVRTKRL